jgi:1,4-dihydroxy-6-naphthoate synthase
MPVTLRLGHSPDSDDAFMFHGLAAGSVDTGGLRFEHVLRDIQTLNDWAREGRLDCTAISVHAYAHVRDKYAILRHGASMGDGYGPMVVAREKHPLKSIGDLRIAVPGRLTSAFLALSIYLPSPFEHEVVPFDRIVDSVKSGQFDAGLIIHEGQLTHAQEGLICLLDLGAWWKSETGLPLPLGVNTIRRDLSPEVQSAASSALKKSIEYGLRHRGAALDYAMQFARDMELATADRFVGMYVNDWTVDMGERGMEAIRLFLTRGGERGLVPAVGDIDFVA